MLARCDSAMMMQKAQLWVVFFLERLRLHRFFFETKHKGKVERGWMIGTCKSVPFETEAKGQPSVKGR